jgi:hypothetical protein
MTTSKRSGPKVKTERPDPEDAARNPGFGSQDRPGFDLGGAKDKSGTGSNVLPRGPAGSPAAGQTGAGRAGGLANPAGTRPRPGGGSGEGGGSEAGSGPTEGRGGGSGVRR